MTPWPIGVSVDTRVAVPAGRAVGPYSVGLGGLCDAGKMRFLGQARGRIRSVAVVATLSLSLLAGCLSTSAPPPTSARSSGEASPSRSVDRDGLKQSIEDQISRGSVSYRNIEAIVVRVDGATELERYWNSDAGR